LEKFFKRTVSALQFTKSSARGGYSSVAFISILTGLARYFTPPLAGAEKCANQPYSGDDRPDCRYWYSNILSLELPGANIVNQSKGSSILFRYTSSKSSQSSKQPA